MVINPHINNAEFQRANTLFQEHKNTVYKQTDRIFAILLPIQWLASIFVAYFLSPLAWNGEQSYVHPHIWFAVIIGGIITSLPTYLTIFHPGKTITRHIVAISQMLMSGILIHISGGRIETHFHVFGSLAFLACYRDWRVLVPATIVTAADHFLRGWFYPYSIYGVANGTEWRWLEHAGWVVFTDIFLIVSCLRSVREMREIANQTAALNHSEERYRAVVEQTSDGIVLIEPSTLRVIECNEAFSRLIGCKNIDEAKTLSLYDFTTENSEEFSKLPPENLGETTFAEVEKTYRRRNGSQVKVEISSNLISYNENQALCLNVKDITERKRSEEEIQKLALVAQKTQNAVIITNPEGHIQWVNDGFTRITGYEINEVLGKKPGNFLQGKETNKETIAEIRKAIDSRKPFEGEIYNYGKNGRGYWLSLSIMPISNEHGELQGFIAVEMDITERKAMEEQLRLTYDDLELRISERTTELVKANESMRNEVSERKRAEAEMNEAKQFLHAVIDNVSSLIFVKDIEGKFVLANRALAEVFGIETNEIIGKTSLELNRNLAEAQKSTENDINALQSLEETFVPEEKHTDAQGNVHWFQIVKRSVTLGEKDAKYLVCVATDLTERKIMEGQLHHAQKMESIGQLAAGIAHEINTPTQYVGDNTRFILDAFNDFNSVLEKYGELFESAQSGDIKPELISEISEEIKNSDLEYLLEEIPNALRQSLDGVSRIAKIVQSMKDFAHPDSREKQSADINRAIESTITVARNEWKYVADLEMNFDQNLPPVPCFLGEFNQVILNMVINAAHAIADVVGDGSKGKGKITVSTTKANDEWAEIRIGDTGSGIPAEIRRKIFDPFFTTKEVGKGTGQGLAISHTVVVDKHHGQLKFETESGRGTTFIIRLPLGNNETSNQNEPLNYD